MKPYKRLFKEDANSNANELSQEIEKEILKIFPKSYVDVKFDSHIFPGITIKFGLGKDKSEWPNGYWENDPAQMFIFIRGQKESDLSKDGTINGLLYVENKSGSFLIKPTDRFMAYSKIKVPFRKTIGNGEKIIQYLKKYFLTFKKALQDNRDKMTDEHIQLIGDKF
jgi:hypothetical protein